MLWFVGLMLATNLVGMIVARVLDSDHPWIDVGIAAADAVIIAACCYRDRAAILPMLRKGQVTTRQWAIAGVALLGMTIAAEAWLRFATLLFDTIEILPAFKTHGWPLWSAVVLVVVLPPIAEELAFRGFLLTRLTRVIGARDALLLQAAVFAIVHISPVILPSHFAIGLALGIAAQRTGSLVPGMLMHAIWNGWCVVEELAGSAA